MALTRQQLRQQTIKAQWEAEMHRPPTRKQARAWVSPLHRALSSLLQGEVDSVKGHPVFEIKWAGNSIARIDEALNGFVSLVERMEPGTERTQAIQAVSKKLYYGIMLTEQEIYAAIGELSQLEDLIIRFPRKQLMDWVQTEQISCALQARGQA